MADYLSYESNNLQKNFQVFRGHLLKLKPL